MPQTPGSVPAGWEVVEESAPEVGSLPQGWEVVEDTSAPTNHMAGIGGAAALAAGVVPAVKGLAERVATQPALGATAGALVARAAGPLNVATSAYDYFTGKRSLTGAATQAAVGEGARRLMGQLPQRIIQGGAQMAQRAAAPVAQALGAEGVAGMAAPVAVPLAGGLAGVAGTAGFLGALQHDANRHVDIDYSKNTPDTDIARVFMNMRNSEANRGRSLDQRMDDPNDVMFQADDSATVTPTGPPEPGMLQRLAILAGLRGGQ